MKYTGYWNVECKNCEFKDKYPYLSKAKDVKERHEEENKEHRVEISQIK